MKNVVERRLHNISAPGACVQVEEPIPAGSPVMLMIGAARFPGVVSYSMFRDYGYFVGIRFSDQTLWSSDSVLPQHLTNLEAMADTAAASV